MKILLADDHALFQDGLRLVLAGVDSDLRIVEATDYPKALDSEAIRAALERILSGGTYLPPLHGRLGKRRAARQDPATDPVDAAPTRRFRVHRARVFEQENRFGTKTGRRNR